MKGYLALKQAQKVSLSTDESGITQMSKKQFNRETGEEGEGIKEAQELSKLYLRVLELKEEYNSALQLMKDVLASRQTFFTELDRVELLDAEIALILTGD